MRTTLLALVALALVAAAPRDDKNGKSDQDLIQGTWKVVEGERNGEKPPQEFLDNFKITFKGDKAIPEGGGGGEASFKLDTGKKPRQITVTRAEGNRTMKGIYQLDGDTLKICFGGEGNDNYPTEFTGKAGSNNMLMVFKRQK